jgi:hypothetical protein
MAQKESDREDLMREAVALVRRAELSYPARPSDEPVSAGFRRDRSLAIYFGADPVFQFDAQHRLRRAYASGHLYRTQGQTLARLMRDRSPEETVLQRHDLDADELEAFLNIARNQLMELHQAIQSNAARVLAQVPTDGDCLPEIAVFLAEVLRQEIRLAPAVAGKR